MSEKENSNILLSYSWEICIYKSKKNNYIYIYNFIYIIIKIILEFLFFIYFFFFLFYLFHYL